MLPFGIGLPEILVCLVVVLLVVGPQKLPDMARTLGKGLRTARRAGQDLKDAIDLREPMHQARRSWESHLNVDDAELYDQQDHYHDDHIHHPEEGQSQDAHGVANTVARAESVTPAPAADSITIPGTTIDGSIQDDSKDKSGQHGSGDVG